MITQKLIDNFSSHLRSTIARAISLAAYLKLDHVEPVHLVVSLTQETGSVGAEILKRFNMTHDSVMPLVAAETDVDITKINSVNGSSRLPELSENTRLVLEKALLLGYDRSHNYVGTEHLLHGLITSGDVDVRNIFVEHLIEFKDIESIVETSLQNTSKFSDIDDVADVFNSMDDGPDHGIQNITPTPVKQKKSSSVLAQFTSNLTHKKQHKNLDPVIGREKEIERIIYTLARRNKNNLILVGEPGVGKTAIVEGLAKRIAAGDVPDSLRRKKIVSLDLTLLIAGTIYRGEFESRLKAIMDEIAENPDYILFIDEIHNIIGAGSNQGTLDAANILKPALARGQLRCIGATTYDEYKKYIASDPALERRFELIHVDEPSVADTNKILQGIKPYYEEFHNVTITNEAISRAVELSNKYIHGTFQPDKSIDILDESAARIKSQAASSDLQKKYYKALEQKETYEEHKTECIEQEDLQQALIWKKKLQAIEKKIKTLETQISSSNKTSTATVDADDVARTISKKMNISEQLVLSNEWDQLQTLTKRLQHHVVGQNAVLEHIVASLKKSHIGITRENKPFASFLFAGLPGVGKTELAKALAQELYQDKKSLIKLDMSEFAESHSVSKILGAPAGYVGFKERNTFLDEIKKRPYSIIVFDEFDKAHSSVRTLLLQMLDEGCITDSSGKQINLQHAIVILTTNVGSELYKSSGIGFGNAEHATQKTHAAIQKKLQEELGTPLISRLDSTLIFEPLQNKDLQTIIKRHIKHISAELKQTQNLGIKISTSAINGIITESYNQDLGARNISRRIDAILNELLIQVLSESEHTESVTLKKNGHTYSLS